jgi:hypothetical protein
MTLPEIIAIVGFGDQSDFEVGPVTKALFWLRTMIGRILRWDEAKELSESISYHSLVAHRRVSRRLVVGGEAEHLGHGPFGRRAAE